MKWIRNFRDIGFCLFIVHWAVVRRRCFPAVDYFVVYFSQLSTDSYRFFTFHHSFHLVTRCTDLITFMSFKFFVKLIEGNPVPFAVNYTVGNTLALSSSAFLCGPKRQFKNMFDERRKLVSTVYLSCLFSTLVVVFVPLPWSLKLATLIALLITQCGANIWYSLSYIPYGRKTALKFIKKFVGMDDNNSGGFMGLGGTGELA